MFEKELLIEKNFNSLVEDLRGLLKIESLLTEFKPESNAPFGPKLKETQEYLEGLLKRDGFTVHGQNNHYSFLEVGEGEETFAVLCHADIVPATGNWQFPPFGAVINDGKLYGRGTIDNKGPLMASYYAVKTLVEGKVKLKKKLRLIFGYDEETNMRCVQDYLKNEKMPDYSFAPDGSFPLIYGEKGHFTGEVKGSVKNDLIVEYNSGTRGNIVPDQVYCIFSKNVKSEFEQFLIDKKVKGEIIDNRYYIYGKSAHAMQPGVGFNANFPMIEFILSVDANNKIASYLEKYFLNDLKGVKLGINNSHPEFTDLTINLAIIKYDSDFLRIQFDIRYPGDFHHLVIEEKIKESFKDANFLLLEKIYISPPHLVDRNSHLVKTLESVYRNISKDPKTPIYTTGGGSYARYLKNGVSFGPVFPNDQDVVHQSDEYISLEHLKKLYQIYLESLYLLCA
ncbi:MAG: Sapep family Mn(2+)-dependent dipeptidase [Erysipelotrichales bacterium]|nr:Sapep family Mn(2+)-dependent dipeptidase [Erysipelotrichales bacterium]